MKDGKWIEMSFNEVVDLRYKIATAENTRHEQDTILFNKVKALWKKEPTRYVIKNTTTNLYGFGEGLTNIEDARNWFSFDDALEAINEFAPENRKDYIAIGIRRNKKC